MPKKPSGLGKGLDELLEDNSPSARTSQNTGKPLVVAKGEVSFTDQKRNATVSIYGNTPKSLYDTKPRTNSVKSNFKK